MPSTNNEVLELRRAGAYYSDPLAAIAVSGQESAAFLQARLSNDVLVLTPGSGQQTAFLDRRAHILARASLHRLSDDSFWLLCGKACAPGFFEALEATRFREQADIRLPNDLQFFSVFSARCDLFLQSWAGTTSLGDAEGCIAAVELPSQGKFTIIRRSPTGERGLTIAHHGGDKQMFAIAKALNMVPLSKQAYETACVEAGELGDQLADVPLAEAGLESTCVSYSKGCFPGQEVLARIRTYGAPRQGVAGLIFDVPPKDAISAGTVLQLDGSPIGRLADSAWSPTLGKFLALAFVQKEYRVPNRTLHITINGSPYRATVSELPFVSTAARHQEARQLCHKALQEFAHGSEAKAIAMLREVIALNPTMTDAYETLGVILNRQDQLDEAIACMQQLAILDPKSVMAHANLSVFYMQKGDKEKAEEEKAISMSLKMSELAAGVAAEQKENEETLQRKAAAQQRMEMFREVLAIDPEDFLANSGLGTVYVDLGEFEKAIAHLQKAIAKRPNHTVAYVALAEAFEKLNSLDEAIQTYKTGIEVAAKRGDGEPLKKMQLRLDALTAKAKS